MWKHQYNTKPSPGEVHNGESMTIQGQSMSIAQMLNRINTGQEVRLNKLEYTDTDEPLPKIRDLTDMEEIQTYVDDVHIRGKQYEIEFEKTKEVPKEEHNEPV